MTRTALCGLFLGANECPFSPLILLENQQASKREKLGTIWALSVNLSRSSLLVGFYKALGSYSDTMTP